MRLPPNGSKPFNCLLLAAGAFMGSGITWIAFHLGGGSMNFGPADAASSESQSSARISALTERAGDSTSGDPAQALSKALAEVDPRARGESLRSAGAAAAKRDVAEALRQAYGLTSKQDQLDFYRGLYGVWGESDPEAALEFAKSNLAAGTLQSDVIGIAVNKWAADHPREAWVWAEQNLSGPIKERALADLMIGWTRRAPNVAADWLAGTGLTSQPLFNAVASTWAEQDPAGAAAWATTLEEGKAKLTAKVAIASEWASQNPAEAAAFFTPEITNGGNQNLAIAITDIWASNDPAETADWIRQLPAGDGRNEAAATLATVWAASDIRAAVAWSATLSDAAMRRQVITHIGTTWGAIEPDSALDWLATLPPADAAEGITGAFYSWAGTDPVGLREWVDSAAANGMSDLGRTSLGDVLSATDPSSSLDLALGMSTGPARNDALARYFRDWRKTDESSAFDWLQSTWATLPADSQTRLMKEADRNIIPR